MNKFQRHNQRVIRDTLNQARRIRSIDVANGHVVEIQTQAWGGYWEGCGLLARELEQLNATWLALIEDESSARRRDAFVRAYFALLHMGLEKRSRGEIGLHVLRKVVAFETFYVCGKRGSLAAGILNVRNPAYMLSRIASPNARDDPEYLPLICPFSGDAGTSGLYCHYRRISLGNSGSIQLFIYPPVEPSRQSVSYSLIGQLMEVADRIVIEDGDLRARHLRRHIDEFGLSTLRVTDMSDRQRMRGASLTLVDKRS